jgi:hypothetical protein
MIVFIGWDTLMYFLFVVIAHLAHEVHTWGCMPSKLRSYLIIECDKCMHAQTAVSGSRSRYSNTCPFSTAIIVASMILMIQSSG